jgi:hypothetical protein
MQKVGDVQEMRVGPPVSGSIGMGSCQVPEAWVPLAALAGEVVSTASEAATTSVQTQAHIPR